MTAITMGRHAYRGSGRTAGDGDGAGGRAITLKLHGLAATSGAICVNSGARWQGQLLSFQGSYDWRRCKTTKDEIASKTGKDYYENQDLRQREVTIAFKYADFVVEFLAEHNAETQREAERPFGYIISLMLLMLNFA